MKTYMQMLLRQTEPLWFSPNPVVSTSSLKLGGASHSSSDYPNKSHINVRPAQRAPRIALTIAVELARGADGQEGLALVLLVGAEHALWALVGDGDVEAVAKREVVLAAPAPGAGAVRVAVGHFIAVGLELVRSLLQFLPRRVAFLQVVDVPREHGRRRTG